MGLLSSVLLTLAVFIATGCLIWIFCNAFNESVLRALPFVAVPILAYIANLAGHGDAALFMNVLLMVYITHYVITRWQENRQPFILMVSSFLVLVSLQVGFSYSQMVQWPDVAQRFETFVDREVIGLR